MNGDDHSPRLGQQNGYHSDNRNGKTFNVSIINQHSFSDRPIVNTGPAKPARTYRSSLLRSKSFNVHGNDPESYRSSLYTSNPQLSTLDESPAPLKSPGIVTSISRSSKNLVEAIAEESSPVSRPHRFSTDTRTNGFHSVDSSHETKRKVFMKGLYDRAPELFKTIHSYDEDSEINKPTRMTSTPLKNGNSYGSYEYSTNGGSPVIEIRSPLRNGDMETARNTTRRGSNDDYSETVRITSKSTDPLRPSVTNTVKSFSKKTIPNANGKPETIESTDVKTVTKSHYRSNDSGDSGDLNHSALYSPSAGYPNNKYSSDNGRLVVQVRNGH